MPEYRTGRSNRPFIYWQTGQYPNDLDELRYAIFSGPDAARVCEALNTPQARAVLERDDTQGDRG